MSSDTAELSALKTLDDLGEWGQRYREETDDDERLGVLKRAEAIHRWHGGAMTAIRALRAVCQQKVRAARNAAEKAAAEKLADESKVLAEAAAAAADDVLPSEDGGSSEALVG